MEINTKAMENYPFGNLKDFNFFKIFEILKAIKEEMKISSLDIKKYCVNSLFIPYNITLLNI